MQKGKGYPSNEKVTDKSCGGPYKQDITGGSNIRSELNKWDESSWKVSDSKKSK